jgi:hypothetical protein
MKIDTTTLLLIAGGAAAVYFLTKPATPLVNPYTGLPYTSTGYPTTALNTVNPYLNQNPTGNLLTGAGSALEGLSDLIGNFF